jgi:hypothetical protein
MMMYTSSIMYTSKHARKNQTKNILRLMTQFYYLIKFRKKIFKPLDLFD